MSKIYVKDDKLEGQRDARDITYIKDGVTFDVHNGYRYDIYDENLQWMGCAFLNTGVQPHEFVQWCNGEHGVTHYLDSIEELRQYVIQLNKEMHHEDFELTEG